MSEKTVFPRFLPLNSTSVEIVRDKPVIRNKLRQRADATGIDVDDDKLAGRRDKGIFTEVFEWDIQSGQNTYTVEERRYISSVWYAAYYLTLLGAILIIHLTPIGSNKSLSNLIQVIGLSLLLGSLVMLVETIKISRPIADMEVGGEKIHSGLSIYFILPGVFAIIIILSSVFLYLSEVSSRYPRMNYPVLDSSPSFWIRVSLLVFVYILLYSTFFVANRNQFERGYFIETIGVGVPVLGGHQKMIFTSLLPAISAIIFSNMIRVSDTLIGIALLGNAFFIWNFYDEITTNIDATYHSIVQAQAEAGINWKRIVIAINVLLFGLATIVTMILFLLESYHHILHGDLLIRFYIVTAAIPLLYVPIGLTLQLGASIVNIISILRRSQQLADSRTNGAPIRKLPTDSLTAGSYSIGPWDYIFVSNGLLRSLDNKEVQAIIAHEEGHIRNNDALLSFIGPFIGAILFVGQNVVYSFVDFKRREFNADQYAAARVGRAPLISALEKFSEQKAEGTRIRISAAPSFTPISTGAKRPVMRCFVTFFGDYALTQIHPSIEERVAKLRET